MSGPFKMKGSPMQRNFGIGGSPMREVTWWEKAKAAGKAFVAGAKETHGGAKAAMETYTMEKKKYRDAAEKNKNKKKK
jgi:hypothetical protein